jgi:uroporphyrinogen decarboxylase
MFAHLGANILNVDSLVELPVVKQKLGDQLCVKGNFDPVRILLQGMLDPVRAAARRCISEGGQGGGFILSPGCEAPRDTPWRISRRWLTRPKPTAVTL